MPVVVVLVALVLAAGGSLRRDWDRYGVQSGGFPPRRCARLGQVPPGPLAPGTYTISEDVAYLGENFAERGEGSQTQILIREDVTDPDALVAMDEAGSAVDEDGTVVVGSDGEAAIGAADAHSRTRERERDRRGRARGARYERRRSAGRGRRRPLRRAVRRRRGSGVGRPLQDRHGGVRVRPPPRDRPGRRSRTDRRRRQPRRRGRRRERGSRDGRRDRRTSDDGRRSGRVARDARSGVRDHAGGDPRLPDGPTGSATGRSHWAP